MSVRGVAHFARKLRFMTTIGRSGFGCFLTFFWKAPRLREGQKAGRYGLNTPKSVLCGDSIGSPEQNTLKIPKTADEIKDFRGLTTAKSPLARGLTEGITEHKKTRSRLIHQAWTRFRLVKLTLIIRTLSTLLKAVSPS